MFYKRKRYYVVTALPNSGKPLFVKSKGTGFYINLSYGQIISVKDYMENPKLTPYCEYYKLTPKEIITVCGVKFMKR